AWELWRHAGARRHERTRSRPELRRARCMARSRAIGMPGVGELEGITARHGSVADKRGEQGRGSQAGSRPRGGPAPGGRLQLDPYEEVDGVRAWIEELFADERVEPNSGSAGRATPDGFTANAGGSSGLGRRSARSARGKAQHLDVAVGHG